MTTELNVKSQEEFSDLIDQRDFRIAQAVVETILNNISSKKKNIHVLTVNCEEENESYDVTIDSKHFLDSLEQMLPYYIKEEKYEDCQTIANTINMLKNNNK